MSTTENDRASELWTPTAEEARESFDQAVAALVLAFGDDDASDILFCTLERVTGNRYRCEG